jgi:glycosyltransferase involved in cell wall biosynthesis
LNPDSPYGRRFSVEVQAAQAEGWARHFSRTRDDFLLSLFDQCDALVHVSMEESFGLVAAEALARNMKLFTTPVGGLKDIGNKVEAVEWLNPEDPAAWDEPLKRWIKQKEAPPASSHLMKEKYGPEQIALQHLRIYQAILGTL